MGRVGRDERRDGKRRGERRGEERRGEERKGVYFAALISS